MEKEYKMFIARRVALACAQVYEVMEIKPDALFFAKGVKAMLNAAGIANGVSIATRRLRDGGAHTFVKIDDWVIDPTLRNAPFSLNEDEYPLKCELKGRGRNPLPERVEAKTKEMLSVALIIRAMFTAPKASNASHREHEQIIIIKLKDLRQHLKRLGSAPSYKEIMETVDTKMFDDVKGEAINGVHCVVIHTGMKLGDWIEKRCTVVEHLESLHKKYSEK